ncbi:hypothetical protein [Microbulbifer marinus]|uniref:Helix-turn-helix domain-containing protein n=1 Tax=Microbulbifer marinus TaxID=658218 RepID=A0A1H3W079_9GAMM|nr:hypothetical protein [Microbulbifer marinus]SDZ79854.1 hypothetical protein SAMN05216562_0391 [Microbulbifer marinus]
MNIPFKKSLLPAMLAGVLAGTLAWADELPDNDASDTAVVESVEDVSSGNIAGFFSDFLGEDAEATVAGLRDGTIQYQPPEETADGEGDAAEDVVESGQDTEVEGEGGEATAGMGYGNVFITLALAEQLAMSSAAEALEGETGMTAEESLNEILYMRQVEGMGWGSIAKAKGFNLGEVISSIRSNRPEKVETAKAERAAGKDMRAEKAQKVEKAERVAKLERPERPVKPERAEKPERPAKPERAERPGR